LGESEGGLDSGRVANDRFVKLLATFNETFLGLVRGLEGSIELLILVLEALHGLLANHALKHSLEVLLQLFVLLLVEAHR